MQPEVSIIVPVFNASNTLSTCLLSIKMQTFANFEVLVVDDGSTDNSPEIYKSFVSSDKRFKCYVIKNEGPSNARNYGIKHSQGKYITFVDSDDYIDSYYLEMMLANIDGSFLVCKRIFVVDGKPIGKKEGSNLATTIRKPYIFTDLYSDYDMFSPFNKLFLGDIIKSNNILFPLDLSYGEDGVFVSQYLEHTELITRLDYYGYYYKKWASNSLSSNVRLGIVNELIVSRQRCYKHLESVINETDYNNFYDFIENEIRLGLALFFSKAFYSKTISFVHKFIIIKDIKDNGYYKESLRYKNYYYQGIMLRVIKFKTTLIQLIVFRVLFTANCLLKKIRKIYGH